MISKPTYLTALLWIAFLWIAFLWIAFLWTLALSPATAVEPLDPAEIEAFADAHFQPALEASGIPGVSLAIVQDGETVLLKGYGVADVGTGAAVDPAHMLFQLGSITKPLT